MRVVYLLNGSALSGGVKVVYQQARALRRLGLEVEVLSPEPPSPWFPEAMAFTRQVESLEPAEVGRADVVIGTMWHTVPVAAAVEGAVGAHLCQCYEAIWDGLTHRRSEIDAIYRLPTLKLAVSPHLAELIQERFRQRAIWIPQAFEPDVFTPPEADRPANLMSSPRPRRTARTTAPCAYWLPGSGTCRLRGSSGGSRRWRHLPRRAGCGWFG